MTQDFAHRLPINGIRDGERIDLVASEDDLQAIAQRIGVRSLSQLAAHAVLSREGQRIQACGRLSAALEQSCVVTGEPVPTRIDEPFDIAFAPEPREQRPDEEIELKPEDCDMVFHDGAGIDLGDAIADSLALALDPYPRSAGAETALREAGVMSEEEAGPFAALAQLKKGLSGNHE